MLINENTLQAMFWKTIAVLGFTRGWGWGSHLGYFHGHMPAVFNEWLSFRTRGFSPLEFLRLKGCVLSSIQFNSLIKLLFVTIAL